MISKNNTARYSLLYNLGLDQRGVAFEWVHTKNLTEILKFTNQDTLKVIIGKNEICREERKVFLGLIVSTKIMCFKLEWLSKHEAMFLFSVLEDGLVKAFNQEFSLILKRIRITEKAIYQKIQLLTLKAGKNEH